jgi:uncharacterized protein
MDDRRTHRRDPRISRPLAAGQALVVMVVALALAAVLGAPGLRSTAESMAPGFWRSTAMALVRPLAATVGLLRLDRPQRLVDSWRNPKESSPSTEAGPAASASRDTTATAGTATREGTVITAADPLRIWVAGDSMVEPVGNALLNRSEKLRSFKPHMTFRISSGLCRPDFFNWPKTMRQVITKQHPEVSVVMFGGNDYQDIFVGGRELTRFTPEWTKEYERRVAQVIQILTEGGGRLYWLGAPVMRDPQRSTYAAELDDIYRRVCARYPRVTYVDTWSLVSDSKGRYTAYLANSEGKMERIREPDGEHLTDIGGNRLAAVIIGALRNHWTLSQ